MDEYKIGDVVLVSFSEEHEGQIVTKRRPAVVVTSLNDGHDVWVVPLTSSARSRPGCITVRRNEESKGSGLRLDSLVDCTVLATIPTALIVNKIGHLSDETMSRVTEELRKNGEF